MNFVQSQFAINQPIYQTPIYTSNNYNINQFNDFKNEFNMPSTFEEYQTTKVTPSKSINIFNDINYNQLFPNYTQNNEQTLNGDKSIHFDDFKVKYNNIRTNNQLYNISGGFNNNNMKEEILNRPKLTSPLMPEGEERPPSIQNPEIKEEFNTIFKDPSRSSAKLSQSELSLIKNEEQNLAQDYIIKSHFDLSLIKQSNAFDYNKVHKISLALLSHFEMPENYEYQSPNISPNGKYISCIARGVDDLVYVWDISDLYWYKYKFSSTQVDMVTFTPDSKAIIIAYKFATPVMYNLANGKKILDFKKNLEENGREGLHCSFIFKENHFAYASKKSLTIWNIKTGEIISQIFDDSPIKKIVDDKLILISETLKCDIIKIENEEMLASFQLKAVEIYKDILDVNFTKDLSSFIYVFKQGIIRYVFKDKEYKGEQKFVNVVEHATLSDDCKLVLKTNMKYFTIYDIDKQQTVCTILQNKFKNYKIDFNSKKLIYIDDICICVKNYEGKCAEKYIWLNKNENHFEDVKFSHDFSVMLAKIDKNNVIACDMTTGLVIKKWQNYEEDEIKYDMTQYGGDRIAIKLNPLLLQIWNFKTQREEITFYGYDCHSLYFSSDGNYVSCGAKSGEEVARIWGVEENKFGIFHHTGTNNNTHTIVHLTCPEPDKLICCSIDQQPLVFDTNKKKLLYKCECEYKFEEVYDIQSDLRYNVFIIKARDEQKRNIGLLYNLTNGNLLKSFINYSILELAINNGIIVFKCDNLNNGLLSSLSIKNLDDLSYDAMNEFKVQDDKCQLLNDHKTAIIKKGDDFHSEYNLVNIENGEIIGKINFLKKNDRKSISFINADILENEIYFRYFEFLSPQETMAYKKKTIYTVDDD